MTDPTMVERFDAMQREWLALTDSIEADDQQLLASWTHAFDAMQEQQLELRRAGLWYSGPADMLGVLRRARRETMHCAVLAWLLDPGAPHGLGTSFLEAFLSEIGLDPAEASEFTETATEVIRERCRADLVITMPRMTVVVEAKVDAFERPDQCDDLFAAFGEDLGVEFVFLTPRGRPPTTATGDAQRVFRRLSLSRLRALLGGVLAGSDRSAPGRPTVESYRMTLEEQFT